jgi:hypothetical protein
MMTVRMPQALILSWRLIVDQPGSDADGQLPSFSGPWTSCSSLASRWKSYHVRYGVLVNREVAVTVTVAAPDQYLEIEFFADGSMEIERFVSQGRGSPRA